MVVRTPKFQKMWIWSIKIIWQTGEVISHPKTDIHALENGGKRDFSSFRAHCQHFANILPTKLLFSKIVVFGRTHPKISENVDLVNRSHLINGGCHILPQNRHTRAWKWQKTRFRVILAKCWQIVKNPTKTRFLPFSSACMAVLGWDMASTVYQMTSIDQIHIFWNFGVRTTKNNKSCFFRPLVHGPQAGAPMSNFQKSCPPTISFCVCNGWAPSLL